MLKQSCTDIPQAKSFEDGERRPGSMSPGGGSRLKRLQWEEAAGVVRVPEIWGQEELLKEWSDCSTFDRSLVPEELLTARRALVAECRRANSGGLRLENRCS